jgi:Sigma-70, region 4
VRAWLYRVAHNRCIDELRRPVPPPPERMEICSCPVDDPIAKAEQRESLRRLISDIRRLPHQQRSALLMRELCGMPHSDMAAALGVSVPAVKSLLVRARMALARALEARDAACSEIRDELVLAHDRRVRPNAMARRHIRDCAGCREFRRDLRGVRRNLAALAPTVGPLGLLAKVLGLGGGAGGGAAAGGGTAAAGTGSVIASAGVLATGAGHVATLIAATVVTAGGAVEIQHTITTPTHHRHHARPALVSEPTNSRPQQPSAAPATYAEVPSVQPVVPAPPSDPPAVSKPAPKNVATPRTSIATTAPKLPALPPSGDGTSTSAAGEHSTPTAAPSTNGTSSPTAGGAGTGTNSSGVPSTTPASSTGTAGGPSTPAAGGSQGPTGGSTAAGGGNDPTQGGTAPGQPAPVPPRTGVGPVAPGTTGADAPLTPSQ